MNGIPVLARVRYQGAGGKSFLTFLCGFSTFFMKMYRDYGRLWAGQIGAEPLWTSTVVAG
jgi:hypothetical protein